MNVGAGLAAPALLALLRAESFPLSLAPVLLVAVSSSSVESAARSLVASTTWRHHARRAWGAAFLAATGGVSSSRPWRQSSGALSCSRACAAAIVALLIGADGAVGVTRRHAGAGANATAPSSSRASSLPPPREAGPPPFRERLPCARGHCRPFSRAPSPSPLRLDSTGRPPSPLP